VILGVLGDMAARSRKDKHNNPSSCLSLTHLESTSRKSNEPSA